jgi:Tol biopolymer transport system component
MQFRFQSKSAMFFFIILISGTIVFPFTSLAQGLFQPLPNRLIFVSTRFSPIRIMSTNPERLEMNTLAALDTDDLLPLDVAWSPRGDNFAIAFVADLGGITDNMDRICIYTQNGIEFGCMDTFLLDNSEIAWSSNGEKLQVLLDTNEGPQIAEVDYATWQLTYKDVISLAAGETLDAVYWSPSGKKIMYRTISVNSAIEGYSLYILDLNGGDVTFLAKQSNTVYAGWSPDEKQIVAVIDNKLTTFTTTGSIASEVTLRYKEKQLLSDVTTLAWSNDGSRIAFSDVYREQTVGVFVFEPSSGEIYQLMDNFFPVNIITWSPDDMYLAMDPCCNGYGEVVVVSLNGWEKWYRIPDDSIAFPAWQPTN